MHDIYFHLDVKLLLLGWIFPPRPHWSPQFGSFNNCQQNSPIKQLSSLCSNWDNNPPELNPFQNLLDFPTADVLRSDKALFVPVSPESSAGTEVRNLSHWERPESSHQTTESLTPSLLLGPKCLTTCKQMFLSFWPRSGLEKCQILWEMKK